MIDGAQHLGLTHLTDMGHRRRRGGDAARVLSEKLSVASNLR
ncbi:hypothetical protein [Mycobacterium dioxanotrophicus]|jgi:hypothetical protein|nr:hypothetical protein [Mycobacterium dioxanotrophicus]